MSGGDTPYGNILQIGDPTAGNDLVLSEKGHGEVDTSPVRGRFRIFSIKDALSNVSGA